MWPDKPSLHTNVRIRMRLFENVIVVVVLTTLSETALSPPDSVTSVKKQAHIQRDCLQRTRFEQYGEYAAEIEEDNNISTCSEVVCTDDENKNINNEEIPQTNLEDGQKAPCVPTVILGASNANRMDIVNDNVCNASINGASFGEIDRLIDKAKNMTNEQIENVILHLGTNDIMTTKNDTDQVMIRVIDALGKVGKAFPDHTKIGVCTILKRKAKGTRPQAFNEAVLKMS
ncbi:uncharacterized protein [Argopecten irradians]|uniref:uncharacterized protein isoform X2 n=1 Tax=Argopecten irradians TaxID=31199 RepID=UPI00370FC452